MKHLGDNGNAFEYEPCLLQEELAAHTDSEAAPKAEGPSTSGAAEEEERQGISAAAEASTSQVIVVCSFPCQSNWHCCKCCTQHLQILC